MAIMYPCMLSATAHSAAGKQVVVPEVDCSTCGRVLIRWGGYWRPVRHLAGVFSIWVPRRRCRTCETTAGLLPEFVLERRMDTVDVVGQAVSERIQGAKIKTIANELGIPTTTVRDWLGRHHEKAPALARGLRAWAAALGVESWPPPIDVDRAAVTALGCAWHAASKDRSRRVSRPWRFWSLITGGVALATNTSPLFPRVPGAREMAAAIVKPPP